MVTNAGRVGLLLTMAVIGLALGQSRSKSEESGSQMAVQRPGYWPQFRGPNRDNISPDTGLLKRWPPGGPRLAWKATGLGSGFSSVSVADGRLYTQGHIEGEEYVIGGFFLHDGYVYGCSTSILMCMNFLTGDVAWKNRSVGMGSVLYADGHFIMRGDGGVVALVEATPEQYREKGRFDQPDRSDRPARTYPVVTGGRLYLRDEGVLLCYDVRER